MMIHRMANICLMACLSFHLILLPSFQLILHPSLHPILCHVLHHAYHFAAYSHPCRSNA